MTTAQKKTTASKPSAIGDDYKTKSIVAAILLTKGTPMTAALENANYIVESLKNESTGTK